MIKKRLTKNYEKSIISYLRHLADEEKAGSTIEKYARDIRAFASWLKGDDITKETATLYKQTIMNLRKATSVNTVIAALNGFFYFLGLKIKLKPLKIHKKTFRSKEKELTKSEYEKLIRAAKSNKSNRLSYIIQTLCATGIRVSELRFITVASIRTGETEIKSKGKTRTVYLPQGLQSALNKYTIEQEISDGCIFITKNGKPITRQSVWKEMKKLCNDADVPLSKVFPHNLRRLFARTFYSVEKDIIRLADILGHSDVNTTRIYLQESGEIHRQRINSLKLVLTST